MHKDKIYFVWLPTQDGFAAQIWYGDWLNAKGEPIVQPKFKKELDETEKQMSLDALLRKFENAKL